MRFGKHRTHLLEKGDWVEEFSSGLLGTSQLPKKFYKVSLFLGWVQRLLSIDAAKEGRNASFLRVKKRTTVPPSAQEKSGLSFGSEKKGNL